MSLVKKQFKDVSTLEYSFILKVLLAESKLNLSFAYKTIFGIKCR